MRILLLLLCFLSFHYLVKAQYSFPTKKGLDRKIIVKDSTGKEYTTSEWLPLTTKYEYSFIQIDSTNEHLTYLLKKMSEEERINTIKKIHVQETPYFKTGEKIASFNAQDIEGNKYKLKDLTGKIVVVFLFYTSTPGIIEEIGELNKVIDRYKNRSDILFLGVSMDEREDAIQKLSQQVPLNFHVIERGRYIANKYNITYFPTHVVLDKTGIVRFHTLPYTPLLTVQGILNTIEDLIDLKVQ